MKTHLCLLAGGLLVLQSLPAQETSTTVTTVTSDKISSSPIGYISINGKVFTVSGENHTTPLSVPMTFPNFRVTAEGVIGQTGEAQSIPDGAMVTKEGQLVLAPSGLLDEKGAPLTLPAYDPAHGAATFNGGMKLSTPTGATQSSPGTIPSNAGAGNSGAGNAGTSNAGAGTASNPGAGTTGASSGGSAGASGGNSNASGGSSGASSGTSSTGNGSAATTNGTAFPGTNGTTNPAAGSQGILPPPGRTPNGEVRSSVPTTNTNGKSNPTGSVQGSGSSAVNTNSSTGQASTPSPSGSSSGSPQGTQAGSGTGGSSTGSGSTGGSTSGGKSGGSSGGGGGGGGGKR